MQQPIFRSVKATCSSLLIGTVALFQSACGTLSTSQRGALQASAETLAGIAIPAAATYYGGSSAGKLASAGLSALASVLQGYVGTTIPSSIVQASPGVANIGPALAGLIASNHTVTQSDVTTVNQAAAIAAASKR